MGGPEFRRGTALISQLALPSQSELELDMLGGKQQAIVPPKGDGLIRKRLEGLLPVRIRDDDGLIPSRCTMPSRCTIPSC